MRWILWSITLLMLLLGALVLVGGLLSREHTVTREADLAAAPAAVFAVIADLEAMPAWRPGVVQVKRVADDAGRRVYREASVYGPVTYLVREARPPERLVLEMVGPGIDGTWTFDLAPAGSGTRLTVREQARIENPMVRFLSRFVTGHGRNLQAYLDALVRHVGPALGPAPGPAPGPDRVHIE
jgi:uncharacterized protein YndB with AHSA1/START domain